MLMLNNMKNFDKDFECEYCNGKELCDVCGNDVDGY